QAMRLLGTLNNQIINSYAEDLGELGVSNEEARGLINDLLDTGSKGVIESFEKTRKWLSDSSITVGATLEVRGILDTSEIDSVLNGVQASIIDKDLQATQSMINTRKDAFDELTKAGTSSASDLASKAYSQLSRQFEVEMVTIEEFKR